MKTFALIAYISVCNQQTCDNVNTYVLDHGLTIEDCQLELDAIQKHIVDETIQTNAKLYCEGEEGTGS